MNLNTSTPDAVNAAAQTRFDGISHADVLTVLGAKHFATLRENSKHRRRKDHDPQPVVHLYLTESRHQWLLTEIDDDDIAFGLCDLGMGFPELGCVDLHEVLAAAMSISNERCCNLELRHNPAFRAVAPLSEYAEQARRAQRIVLSWEGAPSPYPDAELTDMAIADAVADAQVAGTEEMTADGDVMPLAQFLAEFGEPLMAQINRQTPVV